MHDIAERDWPSFGSLSRGWRRRSASSRWSRFGLPCVLGEGRFESPETRRQVIERSGDHTPVGEREPDEGVAVRYRPSELRGELLVGNKLREPQHVRVADALARAMSSAATGVAAGPTNVALERRAITARVPAN